MTLPGPNSMYELIVVAQPTRPSIRHRVGAHVRRQRWWYAMGGLLMAAMTLMASRL
jgi:hypothetical protein